MQRKNQMFNKKKYMYKSKGKAMMTENLHINNDQTRGETKDRDMHPAALQNRKTFREN